MFLEVEGAAHYLPVYAGNLDIMASAALRTAERITDRPAVAPEQARGSSPYTPAEAPTRQE